MTDTTITPATADLAVLACEISARPAGAPTPEQLAPFIAGCHRGRGALCIPLLPEGREMAEAFVSAETLCCPEIGWSVGQMGGMLAIIIQGTPEQLDVVERLFKA